MTLLLLGICGLIIGAGLGLLIALANGMSDAPTVQASFLPAILIAGAGAIAILYWATH